MQTMSNRRYSAGLRSIGCEAICCPGIFPMQVKKVSLSDRQNERITFLKAYQSLWEADGAGGDIRVRTLLARLDCGVAFLIT